MIDLATVISVISGILTAALGIIMALGKAAFNAKEIEINRQFAELRKDIDSAESRLQVEEKATIRQDGDLRMVQSNHSNLIAMIEEIKRSMVTKAEWAPLERGMERLLKLSEERGRYGSSSTQVQAYRGTPSPTDPPKRNT